VTVEVYEFIIVAALLLLLFVLVSNDMMYNIFFLC